ncbi:MAG TPA: metallophosphoesterase [Terriglobales bacterium]|nr:metallophosphoesterase [Terriglobales bacterium]
MSALLHVSDTHFGCERPEVVEALVAFAAALRPRLAVLSGDITQRARRGQFDAAARFAARLGAPVLAIPGNHDLPLFDLVSRLVRPYAGYQRAFGADLEPVHEDADMLVVSVNTTRVYRHKHGEVSAAQVERVASRMRACPPGKLRVVVTHQPMHVPLGRDESNLLRGYADAARAWAAAGADLLLAGHIHLPFVRPVSERVAGLARALWAVNAGTAVSRRVRAGGGEHNCVNVIRYAAGEAACRVERHEHDRAAARFQLAEATSIPLAR